MKVKGNIYIKIVSRILIVYLNIIDLMFIYFYLRKKDRLNLYLLNIRLPFEMLLKKVPVQLSPRIHLLFPCTGDKAGIGNYLLIYSSYTEYLSLFCLEIPWAYNGVFSDEKVEVPVQCTVPW